MKQLDKHQMVGWIMVVPGGAFPLVNVNLVLGAVTCAGKLSLVVEYAEQAVDTETMRNVKDKAMILARRVKDWNSLVRKVWKGAHSNAYSRQKTYQT